MERIVIQMEKVFLIKKSFDKLADKLNKKGIPLPTAMGIFLFFIGTLSARATLFSLLRPFGGAFFAAIFNSKSTYIYILCTILGFVSSSAPLLDTGKYIFAMTLLALISATLQQKSVQSPVPRSALYTAGLAQSGLCFLFAAYGGFTYLALYDLMLLFIECFISFAATFAFYVAMPTIKSMHLSRTFSPIEEISIVSLFGCALWGAKDISNFFIFNLSEITAILIILIFAIRLGSGRGVIAGLTMGLVSALGSGIVDLSSVSYSFSALAASLMGSFGALPACSSFILANALITALANGSTEVLINIFDIFAACFLYAIIPEKILLRITGFGSRHMEERLAKDEHLFSEYVLLNAKSALSALNLRIESLHEKRKIKNETENRFFERIARKGCLGCGMRKVCWGRDSKKTIFAFSQALADFLETGKLKSDLLPANCLRPKEIREAFLSSVEIYRIEVMYKGKLSEMQLASKQQMEAFSEILSSAASSLSNPKTFDPALSDDIARRLEESGIEFSSVAAMRDADSDPFVILTLSHCGGFALCKKGALDIISAATGKPMSICGKCDCQSCRIKYVVKSESALNFAVSGKSRDKKAPSGDSVRCRLVDKGVFAAVLCDGMGFGEKAAFEARGAAETALDLIEYGIEPESAMKIVNSLFLPYGEATFAAADLLIYNACEKETKIIKCGGAASFTKSNGRVDALYSKTMPLGSLLKTQAETFTLSAKSGDIIVMISDGVLESDKSAPL